MKHLKVTKQTSISFYLLSIIFLLMTQTASAQFTIGIPKIPKIKKPKQDQPRSVDNQTTQNTTSASTGNSQTNQPTASASETKPISQEQDEFSNSGFFSYHLDEILKKQKEVDSYNPADRNYFVTETQANYVLFAVSKRARDYWLKDAKTADWRKTHPNNKLDAALDALAASVANKLPLYKPKNSLFQFRNPAAEKLAIDSLAHTGTINAATIKVYKIGVSSAGWSIQKNDYGLPSYRYKYANVYFRDTSEDDSYCHVVSVTVKQDYSGGGTFGGETYRSSAQDEMFGCPAAAK